MAYLLSDGGENIVTYPYTIGMLRRDNSNVSFPSSPSEATLNDWNVYTVQTATQPTIDPYTQTVSEGTPTTTDGGLTWTQTWTITELDASEQAAALVVFEQRAESTAGSLLDDADQYVVTALVQGKALTAEFEAYRASLLAPELLTGYPAATEFPQLPTNIFDENSTEVYAGPGIEEHLAKYHSQDVPTTSAGVEVYRGYNAFVNQFSIAEPSVNQIVVFKQAGSEAASASDVEPGDDDFDTFRVSGISASDKVAIVNVYATGTDPLEASEVESFFKAFVDNVIFGGGETEVATAAEYKTNFYNSLTALNDSLTTSSIISDFEFFNYGTQPSYNISSASFTNVTGNLTLNNISITADQNGVYTINGWGQSGLSSDGASAVIPGDLVGGVSPDNDVTVTYSYAVNDYVLSGVSAFPVLQPEWPTDYIDDGGSDQYDSGNYIVTNLTLGNGEYVPYANGEVSVGDDYFGTNSEYVTTYQDGVFSMFATGASVDVLGYDGETGFDGDGTKAFYQLYSAPEFVKVATKVNTKSWTIDEVGGKLVFSFGGVPRVYFETDGTINAVGDVNTYF